MLRLFLVVLVVSGVLIASVLDSPNETERERAGLAWSDSFESGDFRRWSWWGQGQEDLWGHVDVVRAVDEGVPPLDGHRVARFETTPDDIAAGRVHAKLFKALSVGRGRRERPARDQSGTYSAWYFLPETYSVPYGTSVNAFQLKDNYRTDGGKQSDPLWWVNFGNAEYWSERGGPGGLRAEAPVAYVNSWGGEQWDDDVGFAEVPLGRWFEIRAELFHGERIDFHLDGRPLDTGDADVHPVNAFRPRSINLLFGVGNYSNGANGPLYVDAVGYEP